MSEQAFSGTTLSGTTGSDAIASQFTAPFRYQHAWAYGGPVIHAQFRQQPQDFQVREELSFSLTGEGEHACVLIQKTGANTEWVARQLAQFAGVSARQVSYAGLKDRHAVTEQWFSIHLPKRQAPVWEEFAVEGCRLLETTWNNKKLRRGALRANHFRIVLRDVQGDLEQVTGRLAAIRASGFPNYFAEQRFGHNGNNLLEAGELFASGKRLRPSHKRGLWLSAARSWLFNRVLDKRVQRHNWQQVMTGDVAVLEGTHSMFVAGDEPDLLDRSEQLDIHPSGPLWGVGENRVQGVPAQLEQQALEPFQDWCDGLEAYKTRMDRRALRCVAQDLELETVDDSTLVLHFSLPSGSYATALLREIVMLST